MKESIRCEKHGLAYARESGCPDCAAVLPTSKLAAATKPSSWVGKLLFRCPFCGSKSIREASCSRYACGSKVGLYKLAKLGKCYGCGGRTHRGAYCTKYPCRQLAGTQNFYQARAKR